MGVPPMMPDDGHPVRRTHVRSRTCCEGAFVTPTLHLHTIRAIMLPAVPTGINLLFPPPTRTTPPGHPGAAVPRPLAFSALGQWHDKKETAASLGPRRRYYQVPALHEPRRAWM